ncbi:MAG TPA: arylamine N-acetyltransferase [Nitrospira sp.]|nr:arylamine N-acetyltransferase [Nitrospira sp.]
MVDRSAYLARIGYQGSVVPSMETLRGLHLAHVLTVPFENLDIHLGRPISLDPSDLFRKIVISRRGGYCFELNGLFALLLEELGFVVTRLAARVLYGTEDVRPRSHQVLLVHLDGERWLVDVGFGGQGLREPFLLVAGLEHRQGPDQFRLATDERGEHVLQCHIEKAWTNLYSFTLDPWLPVDYQFANYYHSHAPESPFVQRWMCTMPTLNGRKIFTEKLLKVRGPEGVHKLHVTSEVECKQLLQEHFGLIINDHLRFLV